MRYTIEDLAHGKCAVINIGTLEELNKVLKLAFPNLLQAIGDCKYYCKDQGCNWVGIDTTNLPTQSVKDFLSEEKIEGNPLKVEGQFITENFPRRMRVWDINKEDAEVLIVLAKANDLRNPFIVVKEGYEEYYLKGEKFVLSSFENAEELTTNTELEKLKEQLKEIQEKINQLENK